MPAPVACFCVEMTIAALRKRPGISRRQAQIDTRV
jgi:hypothetical protein